MLRLWRSRRALAGVEFAIVAPFLVTVLLRMTVAADAVATIASTEAVQVAAQSTLTAYQAYAATTAAFAIFPTWLATQTSVNNSFAITLTEVNFTASPKNCTTTCTYTGKVAWSVANPAGQAKLRNCGTVQSVANGTASSMTTLPAGAIGATSVFVADVSQVFTPLFTGIFLGDVTMQRSAYVSPRVNNAVTLLPGYVGPVVLCS